MVSDTELVEYLRELLSKSDLDITTTSSLRRKLEEDLGIDLSDRKAFIREQVNLYLQSEFQEAEEKGDDDDDNKNGEDEEEEVEEEEDDVESSNGKRRSRKKKEEVKKKRGGFNKICRLSPQLEKFTGAPELARTEVVKLLWGYIRKNNLQDPSDKRNILCDDTLKDLFGVDTINMFQMNKALAKHIFSINSDGVSTSSIPKEKKQKHEREEDVDESKRKKKRPKDGHKGGNSGFLASLPLSDALVKFLGTGETALPRSAVVKRIWEYIKLHDIQDPSDRRMIICDEKLKELFDVETFQAFTVTKLLSPHFVKPEHCIQDTNYSFDFHPSHGLLVKLFICVFKFDGNIEKQFY